MQSVLKHFLGKEFPLDYLDKISGRKPGLWTGTVQIVPPLYDLGLDLTCYSKTDIAPMLEGEAYIRKKYGPEAADKVLKLIDIDVVVNATKNAMKYDIFRVGILKLSEIEDNIRKGYVQLALIDWVKIIGAQKPYQGHMVIITGFDDDNIYIHNSGPMLAEANMKVKKELFMEAWNVVGTDNDIIVVRGKRSVT
jgi:hypothetical protein